MKNAMKMIARILVITVIAVSCVAAVPQGSYAGSYPEIYDMQGDQYLYPGQQGVKLYVYLDRAVDGVDLMYNQSGSWVKFKSCASEDSYNDYWSCILYQDQAPKPRMEFRFNIYYNDHMGLRYSDTFIVEWTGFRQMSRIAGKDRFKTAVEVSHSLLDLDNSARYNYVIVASGMDFADALSGSYLSAAVGGAPILLVSNNDQVIQDTADEIYSHLSSDGMVFLLGGKAAVPEELRTALIKKGIYSNRIYRFNGKNRYDTNMKILEWCDYYTKTPQLMVCSGTSFADALSASATGYPIMLVGNELTLEQEAFFMEHDPFIYLIGGTGAVSQAVEDEIHYDFGYMFQRLSGKDRYKTSKEVAEYFFPHQPFYAVLAYGQNFPDGLSGGPLARYLKAPLLLADNDNYMPAEDYFYGHDPRVAIVLGGESLISDYTGNRILQRYEYAAG
ncbi:MAG: cell wall-binding repeat-containing protein [Clostridia bacterium]|nr:cell wall-binding repeat-containing protein [Clostridia bacterium]